MGLHICYELRLPHDASDEHVVRVLDRLRDRACALKPDSISPVLRLSIDELEEECTPDWRSLDWLFRVSGKGMLCDDDGAHTYVANDRDHAAVMGFAVHPGARCEGTSFGFLRPQTTDAARRVSPNPERDSWFWHACCKTQYASVISDEHLIHCHLMLVDLLEECQRLGADVVVRDETGYWDTRSTDKLLAEVQKMNRVVARVAGAFHDAMPPGLSAQGSIFEHPEFERLETPPNRSL